MKASRNKSHIAPARQARSFHTPLSEQRYQDILKRVSEFFSEKDEPTEEKRQQVIGEIVELMNQNGLTLTDLK